MANGQTSLTFQVFGEDKSASKVLKQVAGDAEHTGDKLDGMGTKAHRSSGHMGKVASVAGGVLVAGLAGAATAAAAAGYALMDAAKGAMEDQASAARLAQQLEKTTGATDKQVASVEDWIAKQGTAKGFADDQLRPAFQRLAASTKDLGEAQDLTTLAMDISAATGKDAETVANALAKANDGSVTSLKKLGITLGDNAQNFGTYNQLQKQLAKAQEDAAAALELFGPKSKEYLKAQDKVRDLTEKSNNVAKQGIDVFGELGKQFGGAAATQAETLTGRIGRLKIMFDEAKETIGYKVLPVIEQLVGWFQDKALPVISHYVSDLLPKLKRSFDNVAATVEENRPGLERLRDIFMATAKVIAEKVVPILINLWETQLKTLITVVGKVGEAMPGVAKAFLNFSADAVRAFGKVHEVALDVFGGILKAAEKGLGWIPGVGDKIRAANSAFTEFRQHATAQVEKVATELETAAKKVEEWDGKARAAEEARIRADISDLSEKLRDAKAKLSDPKLTDPERSKIKAEIDDLKEKVSAAKSELAEVKDRTVTVTVNLKANQVKFRAKGSGEGEGGMGPGTTVGHGLMAATHGKGHPGARFAQWGPRWSWNNNGRVGQHDGADISVGPGTPVYATWPGTAVRLSGGWAGNHTVLHANNGTKFIYAHLSRHGKGGSVQAGDVIGYVGSTGNSSGPHLHIQASRNGHYVNPAAYLAQGGIIPARPGGTVVVAGEAGRDEAVLPLPSGWRGGAGGPVGGTVININVAGGLGDRQAVARDVRNALLELQRANGGTALGLA